MRLTIVFFTSIFLSIGFMFWGIASQQSKSSLDHSKEIADLAPSTSQLKTSSYNAEEIFELRYSYYQDEVESLKEIQTNMIVLIIISLLVIIFKARNLKIPLISFPIPEGIIYLLIFVGGIYVWANFGLTFNNVIESRLSLHHMLIQLQTNELQQTVDYRYSLEHILADSSLIDNFCIHYFDFFQPGGKSNMVSILTYLGLYGVYGYLLGLYLSCIIVSTVEYAKRRNINQRVFWLMIIFMFLMLIMSCIVFGIKMPFACVWIGSIWAWASIGIGVWKWKWDKIVDKRILHKTEPSA